MTKIYKNPVTITINSTYSELAENFWFYSDIIGTCTAPAGFTFDWESVPIIRGTSKISGLVHDYLCRINSVPVVSKKIAADVYLEFMKHRGNSWWRRYTKYWVVRFAPGYFHKMKVNWKPEI